MQKIDSTGYVIQNIERADQKVAGNLRVFGVHSDNPIHHSGDPPVLRAQRHACRHVH